MKLRRVAALAAAGSLVLGLAACTSDSDESDALVLYSGRSESLVAPLIEQISDSTGVDIEVRYASTPEMAAQIEQAHRGTVFSPNPWPREQAPLGSAGAPPEVLQIGRHG